MHFVSRSAHISPCFIRWLAHISYYNQSNEWGLLNPLIPNCTMSFWEDNLHLPNKDWHTEAVFSAHKEFISTLFQMGVCFKTHKPRNLAPDPLSGHCSLDSLWPWAEMFVKLRIFIVWIVQDFSKPPISISVLIDRQSRLCCELGRYKRNYFFYNTKF